MKTFALILLSVIFFGNCYAQDTAPNSIISISVGGGMNYGVFGVKTVTGYKNSGLLLGVGYVPGGFLGYEIGGQFYYRHFFMNIGYGICGTVQIGGDEKKTVPAGSFLVGGQINLGSGKKGFIELGVGHTFLTERNEVFGVNMTEDSFSAVIGIGYRIGNVGSKKKDMGSE